VRATSKFDLTLNLTAFQRGIRGVLEYSTDLFERATIARMVRGFARVLERVGGDPDVRLSALDLMDAAERRQVVETWNATTRAYPAGRSLAEWFEAQVERTPEAVAVVCGATALSYRELDARANGLAHDLRGRGIGPESRVGICLERGPALLVAILGVLKAGGAYVPLEPSAPAERLRYMLEDAAVAVLVVQESRRERIAVPATVTVVSLDAAGGAPRRAHAPARTLTGAHLCYVIYTSGSTGRPKGVAMHHQGVSNYIDWGIRHYGAAAGNGAPVFSSMAVDLTITNLLPLFVGRPVHLLADEYPIEALAHLVRRRPDFGLIKITPTQLSLLTPLVTAAEARAATRTLVVGADFLHAETTTFWQEHAPGVRLLNEYGPTETVVGCSAYTLPPGVHRQGAVPVGGPIQNLRFYVVDGQLRPVPVGVAGELYIGGVGVARGYLHRPALSAEKFGPDPFGAAAGGRLYRTGDRARWRADGNLEILGRADRQVKLRGYRVELGEIETVLRQHVAVTDCLVVVREDRPADRQLVAYVVGAVDPEALRAHLRTRVPDYMVPDAIVPLDTLPHTPTGKLDLKTLPFPRTAETSHPYEEPRTTVEAVLADIWASVLGRDRISATANFFDLGGHSLVIMRLVAQIRTAFGVDLSIRTVFSVPTVRAMAAEIETRIYDDVVALSEPEATQLVGANYSA